MAELDTPQGRAEQTRAILAARNAAPTADNYNRAMLIALGQPVPDSEFVTGIAERAANGTSAATPHQTQGQTARVTASPTAPASPAAPRLPPTPAPGTDPLTDSYRNGSDGMVVPRAPSYSSIVAGGGTASTTASPAVGLGPLPSIAAQPLPPNGPIDTSPAPTDRNDPYARLRPEEPEQPVTGRHPTVGAYSPAPPVPMQPIGDDDYDAIRRWLHGNPGSGQTVDTPPRQPPTPQAVPGDTAQTNQTVQQSAARQQTVNGPPDQSAPPSRPQPTASARATITPRMPSEQDMALLGGRPTDPYAQQTLSPATSPQAILAEALSRPTVRNTLGFGSSALRTGFAPPPVSALPPGRSMPPAQAVTPPREPPGAVAVDFPPPADPIPISIGRPAPLVREVPGPPMPVAPDVPPVGQADRDALQRMLRLGSAGDRTPSPPRAGPAPAAPPATSGSPAPQPTLQDIVGVPPPAPPAPPGPLPSTSRAGVGRDIPAQVATLDTGRGRTLQRLLEEYSQPPAPAQLPTRPVEPTAAPSGSVKGSDAPSVSAATPRSAADAPATGSMTRSQALAASKGDLSNTPTETLLRIRELTMNTKPSDKAGRGAFDRAMQEIRRRNDVDMGRSRG